MSPARRTALLLALAPLAAAGCGGEAPPEDAAPADAGIDAPVDSGRADTGPGCAPECAVNEDCCDGVCVRVDNDLANCGSCGLDCAASGRGDGCRAFTCTCGSFEIGCTGTRQSTCCPPRPGGVEGYCADIDLSFADCGGCGDTCDPLAADRCSGGFCVCGDRRTPCAGTAEDRCCALPGVEVGCVDTTSDVDACGTCGVSCAFGETCVDGTCTHPGASCPGGCAAGLVCCDGGCCTRSVCDRLACGRDAGAPDTGLGDAGGADAGLGDVGAPDGSPADAGAGGG